jgi:hypothetical protein
MYDGKRVGAVLGLKRTEPGDAFLAQSLASVWCVGVEDELKQRREFGGAPELALVFFWAPEQLIGVT